LIYKMITFLKVQNLGAIRNKFSILRNKISMNSIKEKNNKKYDVIIVGGGHSGFEAAMASCKRGSSTLLITLNLDKIGWQPCNPSIGGPAKSTLVHEVDALGGGMAKVTDRCYLHKRLLNCSKGPAVWSLRAQTDKKEYSEEVKRILDNINLLNIQEGMVSDLFLDKNGDIKGIGTYFGGYFECKAVVLTTGTFLGGTIWVGSKKISAGRAGEMPSFGLTQVLKSKGIVMGRLKTGTPPRIDSRSINLTKIQKQESDSDEKWFSFDKSEWNSRETLNCYLTHTSPETLSLIRNNLHLSPKYGGFMRSTGPRYCPSIEDKITRFSDKINHQIFLEPEARSINEIYVQGMSTGLPEQLQSKLLKTIPGLEEAVMVRPAYSVDYDYLPALQLDKNLMSGINGLFFAGQVCGTTGYEEASAQGVLSGINASLYSEGKPMVILSREGSFLGTMIDDLCTKQLREPYRVLTSRSEYRLLLRSDNADFRLTPIARKYGLISDREWKTFKKKIEQIEFENFRLEKTLLKTNSSIQNLIQEETFQILKKQTNLSQLISRPHLKYEDLSRLGLDNLEINFQEIKFIEIELKYKSYIQRQENIVSNIEKMMGLRIGNINFMKINQLSKEGREKLTKKRPKLLREVFQMGGVSTSDIQTLMLLIGR
jgi:tRNA uridine 5-carboxymethylaminomethyl modification enzyme